MANWTIFSLITALAIVSAAADDYNHLGNEIFNVLADVEEFTCTKTGAFCSSDCSKIMVCAANNPTPITNISCSSPNQYCVGSVCTSIADPSCPNGPSFICTDDGVFPEPSDCKRSRVCKDGVSKLYECNPGFVFNSRLNLCQLGSTPCTRIDCSRATAANPYIVYASNPAYYALCVNNGNGNIQTIMFKCPYEHYDVFDTTTFSCRYNCAAKGYFQNPANCTEYFHCNGATSSTRPTVLSCPEDFVFDGTRCNSDPLKCANPPADAESSTEPPEGV